MVKANIEIGLISMPQKKILESKLKKLFVRKTSQFSNRLFLTTVYFDFENQIGSIVPYLRN